MGLLFPAMHLNNRQTLYEISYDQLYCKLIKKWQVSLVKVIAIPLPKSPYPLSTVNPVL